MATVQCFAPVALHGAKILILGSMPGKASLQQQQYYAHPKNLFWPIMGELFGAGPDFPYAQRLRILQSQGVALWDVLKECYRESALDSDIVEATIIANDFAGFFSRHPGIQRIYFNGAKAEQVFRKFVLPVQALKHIQLQKLPSTSPANASIPRARKLEDWRQICNQFART
jgi:hypoxanthine-DNA glycosylase